MSQALFGSLEAENHQTRGMSEVVKHEFNYSIIMYHLENKHKEVSVDRDYPFNFWFKELISTKKKKRHFSPHNIKMK